MMYRGWSGSCKNFRQTYNAKGWPAQMKNWYSQSSLGQYLKHEDKWLIDASTEPVTSFEGIRGVNSAIFQNFLQKNINRTTPTIYRSRLFDGEFYPADHLICYARKSKPAYFFRYGDGVEANIPINEKMSKHNEKSMKYYKSLNPMNYSTYRTILRRLVKKSLWEHYCSIPNTKDGLYSFKLKQFPLNDDPLELDRCMQRFVKTVSQLTENDFKWVSLQNKKLSIPQLNRICDEENIPRMSLPADLQSKVTKNDSNKKIGPKSKNKKKSIKKHTESESILSFDADYIF